MPERILDKPVPGHPDVRILGVQLLPARIERIVSELVKQNGRAGKRRLLASNTKLDKATDETAVYRIQGLTLAPHSLSGDDLCPGSSAGCRASCNLWFSGLRIQSNVRACALAYARFRSRCPELFLSQLHHELALAEKIAARRGKTALVRLNVASDVEWATVVSGHPKIVFYDYTKVRSRFDDYLSGRCPENYHLTFSRHEKHSDNLLEDYLLRGGNVAIVLDVDYYPAVGRIGALPERCRIGKTLFDVVDGDAHDVRLPWIDGRGKIIGLRLKGASNKTKQRARVSGFAI